MNQDTINAATELRRCLKVENIISGTLTLDHDYFYFIMQPIGSVCKECKRPRTR